MPPFPFRTRLQREEAQIAAKKLVEQLKEQGPTVPTRPPTRGKMSPSETLRRPPTASGSSRSDATPRAEQLDGKLSAWGAGAGGAAAARRLC